MRLIYHDGKTIPEAFPKDPASDTWYGFEYILREGELITSDSWLIDSQAVVPGDVVNGLEFVGQLRSGNMTKVNLKGGTAGVRYLVSNQFSTNLVPLDTRSVYVPCERL